MRNEIRYSILSMLASASTGEVRRREIIQAHRDTDVNVEEVLMHMRQDGLIDHRAASSEDWFVSITRKGRLELSPEPVQ